MTCEEINSKLAPFLNTNKQLYPICMNKRLLALYKLFKKKTQIMNIPYKNLTNQLEPLLKSAAMGKAIYVIKYNPTFYNFVYYITSFKNYYINNDGFIFYDKKNRRYLLCDKWPFVTICSPSVSSHPYFKIIASPTAHYILSTDKPMMMYMLKIFVKNCFLNCMHSQRSRYFSSIKPYRPFIDSLH